MRLPISFRKIASRLLAPIKVRIKSGPNSGCYWSLPASGRHRSGEFEKERIELLKSLLSPGDCFWDMGAHHGYVSVMGSNEVGDRGEVLAFEPSAYNYSYLRRHLQWNRCENVSTFQLAVADVSENVQFGGSGSSHAFSIGGGEEKVEAVAFQELLASDLSTPDVIKIDVEGAETRILASSADAIPGDSRLLIALHSDDAFDLCTTTLSHARFDVWVSERAKKLYGSGQWTDDPNILAVGPQYDHVIGEYVRDEFGFTPLEEETG